MPQLHSNCIVGKDLSGYESVIDSELLPKSWYQAPFTPANLVRLIIDNIKSDNPDFIMHNKACSILVEIMQIKNNVIDTEHKKQSVSPIVEKSIIQTYFYDEEFYESELQRFFKNPSKRRIDYYHNIRHNISNYELFSQQCIGAEQICRRRHIGTFYDMRVGKTLTAILAARQLFNDGEIDGVIVVSPSQIIKAVWETQLEAQDIETYISEDIETDIGVLSTFHDKVSNHRFIHDMPAYIISFEKLRNRVNLIVDYINFDRVLIILDESAKVKNPSAVRSKATRNLTYSARYLTLLSGSPMSNGPQDIWNQLFLLDRGARLGASFNRFLNDWLFQFRTGKYLVKKELQEDFESAIQSISIRWIRSEADQFSGKDSSFRWITLPMSLEGKVAYNNAIDGYVELCEEQTDIKMHTLTLMGYLREISCGYNKIRLEENGPYSRFRLPYDPKTLWIESWLLGNPGVPAVIFTEFNEHDNIIEEMLKRNNISYRILNKMLGSTGNRTSEAQDLFQNGEIRVLMLKPSQCYGLTLNRLPAVLEGNGTFPAIIFAAPGWALDPFLQGKDRCIGVYQGKNINTPIFILVMKNSIEEKIVEAIKRKQDISETILKDALRKGYYSFAEELRISDEIIDDEFDPEEMFSRSILNIDPLKRPTHKLLLSKLPDGYERLKDKPYEEVRDYQLRDWQVVRAVIYLKNRYDVKGYLIRKEKTKVIDSSEVEYQVS